MTKQVFTNLELSDLAIKGLQEVKAKGIVRLDLIELEAAVTDYFIIATGTSDRHVQALANSVMDVMKEEAEEHTYSKEGLDKGEWVVLDYASVVIHIFQSQKRDFYRLESLWGDAEVERFEDVG
jgi:ribosome-associated protein